MITFKKDQNNYYIGIMSGTSLDGIDAALAHFDNDKCEIFDTLTQPIPEKLKNTIISLSDRQSTDFHTLGEIDHLFGKLFAESVIKLLKNASLKNDQITAIGCHGQTLFHSPGGPHPFTIQIGDPNIISTKTGITVVADFRRKDMAYGGQGAPLVPAFHESIFRDDEKNRVILNIGGIANITVLINNEKTYGYDTGPGNILMDTWIKENKDEKYDYNANWAVTGSLNKKLLENMLDDPYFSMAYPKSTGREYFNIGWIKRNITGFSDIKSQDIQKTLASLTSKTIADSVAAIKNHVEELIVCGGGVHNPLIMKQLKSFLPHTKILSASEYNIDPDYVEAAAFAWLAKRTIHKQSGNIPTVTGASKRTILGGIYLADI